MRHVGLGLYDEDSLHSERAKMKHLIIKTITNTGLL